MTQQELDKMMTDRWNSVTYFQSLSPELIWRLAFLEGYREGGRGADTAWVKRWDEATAAKDEFVRRVGGGL